MELQKFVGFGTVLHLRECRVVHAILSSSLSNEIFYGDDIVGSCILRSAGFAVTKIVLGALYRLEERLTAR